MLKIGLYPSLNVPGGEWLINDNGERLAQRFVPDSEWRKNTDFRTWVIGYAKAEAGGKYPKGETFTRTPIDGYFPIIINSKKDGLQLFPSAIRSIDNIFELSSEELERLSI